MVQEELLFKGISYLDIWQPFWSTECNHLCYCGRGYFEEQFCENYFEFVSVVQEQILFKRFFIWSSGSPPVRRSGPINAILKEGITGNIHVKLCEIRTSGSGRDVV